MQSFLKRPDTDYPSDVVEQRQFCFLYKISTRDRWTEYQVLIKGRSVPRVRLVQDGGPLLGVVSQPIGVRAATF